MNLEIYPTTYLNPYHMTLYVYTATYRYALISNKRKKILPLSYQRYVMINMRIKLRVISNDPIYAIRWQYPINGGTLEGLV